MNHPRHSTGSLLGRSPLAVLVLTACFGPPPDASTALELPAARLNDLTAATGEWTGDTLDVALDLVNAAWMPRGESGPRIPVAAFAEPGGEPVVPAPLIRVRQGSVVRLTVTNRLMVAAGLHSPLDAASGAMDGSALEAGESRTYTFHAAQPAASVYGARLDGIGGMQGASRGPIIVDPADEPPHPDERILHIESWGALNEPGSLDPRHSWKLMVNGRSWPFTERLEYTVGDTVRWRVINSSAVRHPMHLHGFFFDVLSAGDLVVDTVFAAGSRAPVVTHAMDPMSSMAIRWVPTEPGNWLFHCHLLRHMGPGQRFAAEVAASGDAHAMHEDAMAGLITGITVHPAGDLALVDPPPSRRIDLWTTETPRGWGNASRLAFVEQRGAVPAADSMPGPSSTLVLRRDEATEIVVHNRYSQPLSVHWHGLELPSLYDGVGGWSGPPDATRPPVAPGDSIRVVLRPPRAGTFMYHTHGESGHELAQGLYGALIVLDTAANHDPSADRVYLLGSGGAQRDARPAINGELVPPPERFEPGRSYRLRFAQIAADESKVVRLLRDGAPVRWTPIAKDGADLTAAQRVEDAAEVRLEVGETQDFEWRPEPGVHQLVVTTIRYPLDEATGATQTLAFVVGESDDVAIAAAHAGFDGVLSRDIEILLARALAVTVLLGMFALVAWSVSRVIRWLRRPVSA